MEDVSAMTKEYHTVASLWDSFHQLMRSHDERVGDDHSISQDTTNPGLPGTGGHVLSSSKQSQ
jgi:DASH complex subunit DAD1